MVITPLVQKGIDVKLPETSDSSSGGGQPTGLIVVTLQAADVVEINQIKYELRGLLEELRRLYSTRQDKTVFIRALAKLPFAKVMEVIDIARGAGIETIWPSLLAICVTGSVFFWIANVRLRKTIGEME